MRYLHNGYYEVRLKVSAEFVRHALEQAIRWKEYDATDYINGVLNMALLSDFDRVELEREQKASERTLVFDEDDMERR